MKISEGILARFGILLQETIVAKLQLASKAASGWDARASRVVVL